MAKQTETPSGPPLGLSDGTSDELSPRELLLDPANLRLLEREDPNLIKTPASLIGQPAIQSRLHEILLKDELFDVKALATSIANNGFLKHERIIVARFSGTRYLVLEGNRRLAAVHYLLTEKNLELNKAVEQSLLTLPCFVLSGPPIDGSESRLANYRHVAEIFIGMRHLMGAKSWEPASRYEFQARLIDEGWSIEQVADRFGRKKRDVLRDLKAQRLYRDFRLFEKRNKTNHNLTYNAFAEAARAPVIANWLGWSKKNLSVENTEREEALFHYLIIRLRISDKAGVLEGEEVTPQESAETIVRHLRDMLKLADDDIEAAIVDRDFEQAELLFEERKEGQLTKRLTKMIRTLGLITVNELEGNRSEIIRLLQNLGTQVSRLIALLTPSRGSKR
jgi:hypothetical protein